MPKIKCEMCGCEFMAKHGNRRNCDKCKSEKTKKYKSEYRQKWKSVGNETGKKTVKKTEKPILSINDIVRMSMAAGKSGVNYGYDVLELEGK